MRQFVFLVLISAPISVYAQQETYLTHFAFNKVLYNPAYAGINNQFCLTSFHHKQWLALKDFTGTFRTADLPADREKFPVEITPVSQGITFSAPIFYNRGGDQQNIGGVSFAMVDDVIAYEKNTHIKFGIAYQIQIGKNAFLRAGLDADHLTKSFNTTMLRAITNPDPAIPSGTNPSDSKWLIGSGIYLKTGWHQFFSGMSMSSVNKPKFSYPNMGMGTTTVLAASHFYWISGMVLDRGYYTLRPVVLIKSANAGNGWVKPQMDMQCNAVYRNVFSFGAGIRGQVAGLDGVQFLVGVYPGKIWPVLQPPAGDFRIGYSYDVTLQSLRLNSNNSHELQVNYCFTIKPRLREVEHPRFLMLPREKIQKID